jgi:hypothetical protein
MRSMTLRHAAALVLVGWYLMVPPTQEMLDSSCSNHRGILDSLIATITRESDNDRLKRCDGEATMLVPDAPFSRWVQGGEFETLAECRADQTKPLTEKDTGWAKFAGELTASSGVSKEDLIRTQKQALTFSKCLASDDPRLKEK